MSTWWRILLMLLMCVGLRSMAQRPMVVLGKGAPSKQVQPPWYLDEETRMLWVNWKDMWIASEEPPVLDYFVSNHWLFLHCANGHHLYDTLGAYLLGAENLVRMDSLVVMWDNSDLWVLDRNGQCLTGKFGTPLSCYSPWRMDTLEGVLCVCLHDTGLESYHACEERHAWGMRDGTARWVIPPIYDAPFDFVAGYAEVIYYGEKRRINTKGELQK